MTRYDLTPEQAHGLVKAALPWEMHGEYAHAAIERSAEGSSPEISVEWDGNAFWLRGVPHLCIWLRADATRRYLVDHGIKEAPHE